MTNGAGSLAGAALTLGFLGIAVGTTAGVTKSVSKQISRRQKPKKNSIIGRPTLNANLRLGRVRII